MDVFNDYLAFGGDMYEPTLVGLSTGIAIRLPYIALMSISNSDKIYWAKGFI